MTISSTEAEIVIANALKAIKALADDQSTILNDRYNAAKAYVQANSGLFDAGDITKLNGLQTDITSAVSVLDALKTQIATDFPNI